MCNFLTTESDYLFAKYSYFLEKCDILCEGLYTLTICFRMLNVTDKKILQKHQFFFSVANAHFQKC